MAKQDKSSLIQVSVTVLAQLIRYLKSQNADIGKIFQAAGADPAILESPDARIAVEQYIAIEDEAARITGDPYLGLHMGEFAEPGSWSILGYLMMNCKNLGEAFEKSGRYAKIIGNLIEGKVQLRYKKVKVILTVPKYAPKMSRHCFESVFSSTMRIARTLSGKQIDPIEVGFAADAPESTDEYQRIFRCPVLFGQKHNYMVLHYDIGRIPVTLPNPQLKEQFETYAQKYLEEIEETNTATGQVIKSILARMDNESLSIRTVAKDMGISVRTLQNRLAEEGKHFRTLLQETKENLAKSYLKENYTIENITYLLGFSEPSAFRKAFKSWTGSTPKEFRDSAAS